ncbi:hypothetical protein ACTMTJ_15180 [Phytohabitans sp. LJ34]|uniref:hypothetical protein n=1 Tax=Phytohabitans sp. LJ34 TaxID=3452217 RepID=UPI003F8A6641
MQTTHTPPVDGIPTVDGRPAPGRRRRRVVLAAGGAVVVLAAAVFVGYLTGGLNDDGRFSAEPPACETIAPSVALLGVAYTTRQSESNSCDLLLPQDHPDYIAAPKITVSYGVAAPRRKDAPETASEMLRPMSREARPLPGVGDEAYLRGRDVFLRVSNLVVAIVVFPRQASTQEQVLAFATDIANRLGEG